MRTFNVQDKREYSVSAAVPVGRAVVKEANHPTSVEVDREFSWYVVGHVTDGVVRNPGVGYLYKDGPASSIKLVRKDGTEVDLPKGYVTVVYLKGDQPTCTQVDSREVFRGAKFPVEGTYTIWLCAGYTSDAEAAMGRLSLGGMYELVTMNIAGLQGAPIMVNAWPWDILSAVLAGAPLLLVGGAIAANEILKRR